MGDCKGTGLGDASDFERMEGDCKVGHGGQSSTECNGFALTAKNNSVIARAPAMNY